MSIKIQIQGRTLNKKGMAALALATTIAVSSMVGIGYKAVDTLSDAVVAEAVSTTEVQVAYGTEVSTVWEAIYTANPGINKVQAQQAMDMVHELNNTSKYTGWEQDMPAATYIIPIIK